MKNLIILLLLSPLCGFAQQIIFPSDSASVKINMSVQARDAEYLNSFIAHNATYEDLFDALKAKFRVANPPSVGTLLLAVDSVEIRTWLYVMNAIRRDYVAIQAGIFTRLNTLLRAKNNAYINKVLDAANAYDTALYNDAIANGRRRLRKL